MFPPLAERIRNAYDLLTGGDCVPAFSGTCVKRARSVNRGRSLFPPLAECARNVHDPLIGGNAQ